MVNINLLPPENRAGGTARRATIPAWAIPAGLTLTVLITGASFSLRQLQEMGSLREEIASLNKEKEKYTNQISLIDDVQRRSGELSRRLEAVEVLEKSRGQQVEILDAVLEALPSGIWLVNMNTEPSGRTHIEGRAVQTLGVFYFMSGLENAGPFGEASLSYLRRDAEAESGAAQFALDLAPAPPDRKSEQETASGT